MSVENEIFMDCKKMCFKGECVDAVLLIAVLHHLAGE